jgi:hypothetical protein
MATTITAGNATNGAAISSDNTGILELKSGTGSGTTAVTVSTGQNVTFAQAANLPNTFGFKNRIINGAMVIDQRNAGASVSISGTPIYLTDRFIVRAGTGSGHTAARSTDAPTGFKNSLAITIGTGGTPASGDGVNYLVQYIEGFNAADLGFGAAGASTVTISFWVKSSLTGQFGASLVNYALSRSYPFTFTINAANTWEQKSVTIAGDTTGTWSTDNSGWGGILFDLGNGATYLGTAGAWAGADYRGATGDVKLVSTSGATFRITGVQLEKGSTATSFDYRPYGTELQLCQRYYETGGATYFSGQVSGSVLGVSYKVTKRAAATLAATGTFYAGAEATGRNLGSGGTQVTQAFYFESTSNWAGGTWTASAEL